jgi:hypothetical protein
MRNIYILLIGYAGDDQVRHATGRFRRIVHRAAA